MWERVEVASPRHRRSTARFSDPVPTNPKHPPGHDRVAVAVGSAAGIVVLVAMAVPNLGRYPLWLDEAYSLGVANQFAKGVSETGATMFLYYSLLWPWARIDQSTAWIRLLSLMLAVATLPVMALLADRLGGRRLALVVPPLLAASWMFAAMATEARSYALEIGVVTVCWYAIVRAVEAGVASTEARRWWIVLTILGSLGILVHGLFPFYVVAWGVALLLAPEPRRGLIRLAPVVATAGVILLVLLAIGIGEVGSWVGPTDLGAVKDAASRYIGQTTVLQVVTVVAFVGWGGYAARAWWAHRNEPANDPGRLRAWKFVVPLVWSVVPPVLLLALSLVRDVFVARYVAAITPAVALVLGMALVRGVDAVAALMQRRSKHEGTGVRADGRPTGGSATALALVTIVVVASFAWTNQRSIREEPRPPWDRIAAQIVAEAEPTDGIILYSDFARTPLEAAWMQIPHGTPPRVVNMPRQIGEPVRIYDRVAPTHQNRMKLRAYDRIWTVSVGDLESVYGLYEVKPPLTTEFRLAEHWTYPAIIGEVHLRLYERLDVPS